VGPPSPGAIRGLGVLAMLLSPLTYASDAPLSTRFWNPFFPQACYALLGSCDLVRWAFLLLGSMRTVAVVCGSRPQVSDQRDAGAPGDGDDGAVADGDTMSSPAATTGPRIATRSRSPEVPATLQSCNLID
jgi:hypothetical protein